MGNDGGRIGKNSGMSGGQIAKHGGFATAQKEIPLRDQHRHAVKLSAAAEKRSPALSTGRGHALSAGRGQAVVARDSVAARLGNMRSKIVRDLRGAVTANTGRAGNVRNFGTRINVIGTPKGSNPSSAPVRLNNMTRNVYVQVSSKGATAAAARANLGRSLEGTGKSAGFSRVSGTSRITQNPNGTYTASVNGITRGSARTNASFTPRTQGRTGSARRGKKTR